MEDGRALLTVRLDGRTDQHNYYPEAWQRRPTGVKGKKDGTRFSTARTRWTALDVSRVHSLIARHTGQRCYLITHTTAPTFLPNGGYGPHTPNTLNHARREAFRLLLDRLRKLPGYRGHFWTTELHPGNGPNRGTIHHHCVLRHDGYWAYNAFIRRWSLRYCGSVNGLDVQASCQGRHAWEYLGKAWSYLRAEAYLNKETGELEEMILPFRCWGTSKVVRKVKVHPDEVALISDPVYLPTKHRARCARIPRYDALARCARSTLDHEILRVPMSIKLDNRTPTFTEPDKPPGTTHNEVP